jgi:hypothetical protein
LSIVIQKTRQLRMQKTETRWARRWAVLSFGSSALQPDLRILLEHLDLPSQSIPFELLDGVSAGADRQIGDQLLFDFLPVLWRTTVFGVDHRQGQRGVAFLLSDRRQDANLAIPDLENGFVRIAVAVSNVDAMQRFGRDLCHLVGDRVTWPSFTGLMRAQNLAHSAISERRLSNRSPRRLASTLCSIACASAISTASRG